MYANFLFVCSVRDLHTVAAIRYPPSAGTHNHRTLWACSSSSTMGSHKQHTVPSGGICWGREPLPHGRTMLSLWCTYLVTPKIYCCSCVVKQLNGSLYIPTLLCPFQMSCFLYICSNIPKQFVFFSVQCTMYTPKRCMICFSSF